MPRHSWARIFFKNVLILLHVIPYAIVFFNGIAKNIFYIVFGTFRENRARNPNSNTFIRPWSCTPPPHPPPTHPPTLSKFQPNQCQYFATKVSEFPTQIFSPQSCLRDYTCSCNELSSTRCPAVLPFTPTGIQVQVFFFSGYADGLPTRNAGIHGSPIKKGPWNRFRESDPCGYPMAMPRTRRPWQ